MIDSITGPKTGRSNPAAASSASLKSSGCCSRASAMRLARLSGFDFHWPGPETARSDDPPRASDERRATKDGPPRSRDDEMSPEPPLEPSPSGRTRGVLRPLMNSELPAWLPVCRSLEATWRRGAIDILPFKCSKLPPGEDGPGRLGDPVSAASCSDEPPGGAPGGGRGTTEFARRRNSKLPPGEDGPGGSAAVLAPTTPARRLEVPGWLLEVPGWLRPSTLGESA